MHATSRQQIVDLYKKYIAQTAAYHEAIPGHHMPLDVLEARINAWMVGHRTPNRARLVGTAREGLKKRISIE